MLFVLGARAVGSLALAGCSPDGDVPRRRTPAAPIDLPAPAAPAAGSVFPLRLDPRRNCLVDAGGRPFLLVGESAWSLLAQLDRGAIDAFLADRARRGYSAVLVNVLECYFSSHPPYNVEGRLPFAVPRRFEGAAGYLRKVDFDTPVDAYFDLLAYLLERAAAHGLLVMAVPCYPGYEGGEQGWWTAMRRNGIEPLRYYGRYLGQRFRGHRNLLWVQGGDYNVPDRALVEALALGIREYDPDSLHTFHGGRGTGAHDWMGDAPWMALGNIYTKEVVYATALHHWRTRPQRPFILIEAYYEKYETAPVDPRLTRVQAYQAMLSGACGQLSGHDDIWQFRPNWRDALDSATARSMSVQASLWRSLDWWTLKPDADGFFLRAGQLEGFERAVAAVSEDRSLALAYVPSVREVVFDTALLDGPGIELQWIDPTDGRRLPVQRFEPKRELRVRPPGSNAAATSDWILLFRSAR